LRCHKHWAYFFVPPKKYQKNSQRKKLAFTLALLYGNGGHLAYAAFIKIDFSSDSFPLALAFVVPQGKPPDVQSEEQGTYESAIFLTLLCGTLRCTVFRWLGPLLWCRVMNRVSQYHKHLAYFFVPPKKYQKNSQRKKLAFALSMH
jgi:hypothetical protein